MVKSCARWLRHMTSGIRTDVTRFCQQLSAWRATDGCKPGLYTYRSCSPAGRQLRLHLRIHGDGSGQLFVNATDVIHLTPSAATMAKFALDGLSPAQALERLRVIYAEADPAVLAEEEKRIRRVVERLQQGSAGCPTCGLEAQRLPLFSVRAEAPYKADLALTYTCNNDCVHCYNEAGRRAMASLDTADWQKVIDKLYEIGIPYVIFTGGEPTLFAGLQQLIAHAESRGQITGLNTNGRRLAEPGFAEKLKECGLDHVQVTIEACSPGLHNRLVRAPAFEETVQGIRNALACGLHTITNTTLMRHNVGEALDIVRFLRRLGVTTFAMNSIIHSGSGTRFAGALTEDELEPVLVQVRERAEEYGMRFLWYTPTRYCRLSPLQLGLGPRSCNAGEYSICIEPNGDVLPCQSYYQPAGNILTDPWPQVWNSKLFTRFRYRREKPRECGLPAECWECEQLPVCGGGCPLERQAQGTEVCAV